MMDYGLKLSRDEVEFLNHVSEHPSCDSASRMKAFLGNFDERVRMVDGEVYIETPIFDDANVRQVEYNYDKFKISFNLECSSGNERSILMAA